MISLHASVMAAGMSHSFISISGLVFSVTLRAFSVLSVFRFNPQRQRQP